MLVCLSVRSEDEHAAEVETIEAVGGIYTAQGLKLAENAGVESDVDLTGGAAASSAMESSSRRSSHNALDRSSMAFAQVMSAFLPPKQKEPPAAMSVESWLREVGITNDQRTLLASNIPLGSQLSVTLLCQLDEEMMKAAMLTPLQIKAMKALQAKAEK